MFGQMDRSTEINSSCPPVTPTQEITVPLSVDLIERVRNAAYSLPGLTFAALIEGAVSEAIEWLERENGGAFETR